METRNIIDVVGWVGALVVLLAYAAISTGRLRGNSNAYQLMNLAGGIGLTVNTIYNAAYPSALVNIVWIGIAVYSLVRSRSRG